MRRLKYTILVLVFILLLVGEPWLVAFREDQSTTYHYGTFQNGLSIQCVAVDGTHWDRYRCLVYDERDQNRVSCENGKIHLDGKPVVFKEQLNVAFLLPSDALEFQAIGPPDIESIDGGSGGVYYVLGPVPKFKSFDFGVPNREFIEEQIANWNSE